MGEFKKGDFVRCIDESDTSVVKLDGVYKVDEVSGRYVYVVVDEDPHGMLLNRFEPWQPRVGERVKVVISNYERKSLQPGATGVISEHYHTTCYGVDIGGEDWSFFTSELEPVLIATNTAEQPAPLKIEAGKFYKTRDGRKVGPMRVWRLGGWASEGEFSTGLWLSDGQPKYSMAKDSPALIAEWIEEPAAKAKASNENAQPKFKVGDRVIDTESSEGYTAIVRNISTDRFTIEWLEDGKPSGTTGNWPFDDFELVTPPTTTTTIVALIENGQPKPSSTPHVHASTGAAEKEAKRLAAKYKGKQFGVFTLTTTHEESAPVYAHKWQNLAALGLKIDAIKELRSITGMGLKPAKDAVEHFLDAA
ncbi:ribosomal protein L7/L12 [Agrobacterium sp. lyk4-40-TYG-31]|uniref:ribosomal protein L7/L12 n=1 Tax=Agrobacterium sp. lyk4-40-TYG-31 TaxID=3040276 RepID=UPI0025505DBC|nr:ribosomal protein L7/L12 [Agrobacterium sp. lyk4-40-TYG-31]